MLKSLNNDNSENRNRNAHGLPMLTTVVASMILIMTMPISIAPSTAYADNDDSPEDALRSATDQYESAVSQRDASQQELDDINAQIDSLEASLPVLRSASDSALRSMYVSGADDAGSIITSLLGCDSLSSAASLYDSYMRINEKRVEAVQDAVSAEEDLEAKQADKQAETDKLNEAVESAADAKSKAQRTYDAAIVAEKRQAEAESAQAENTGGGTSASGDSGASTAGSTDAATSGTMTLAEFKRKGVVYQNGWKYTYYSESVLPGNGLKIPGRHHEDGLVKDGNGYICVACTSVPKGTVLPTPLGQGIVYDGGCAKGTVDIYIA